MAIKNFFNSVKVDTIFIKCCYFYYSLLVFNFKIMIKLSCNKWRVAVIHMIVLIYSAHLFFKNCIDQVRIYKDWEFMQYNNPEKNASFFMPDTFLNEVGNIHMPLWADLFSANLNRIKNVYICSFFHSINHMVIWWISLALLATAGIFIHCFSACYINRNFFN